MFEHPFLHAALFLALIPVPSLGSVSSGRPWGRSVGQREARTLVDALYLNKRSPVVPEVASVQALEGFK